MSYTINDTIQKIYGSTDSLWSVFPDKQAAESWTDTLIMWLFRTSVRYNDFNVFQNTALELHAALQSFLQSEGFAVDASQTVTDHFFTWLPEIRETLLEDLNAIIEFDPAARSKDEVLLAYPGFFALSAYRIANRLAFLEAPVLPRLISEYAHSKTGIDIHPSAQIGRRFFIDHGTGIVIGETATIGDDVKIYQGVTLGALNVSKDKVMQKRHPTIGNNVTLYANATILGGNTVIGNNAVIGGNVWLTSSIPAHSVVFHKSDIVIKSAKDFPDAINFSI
jgi:serine O-acetyltransferase